MPSKRRLFVALPNIFSAPNVRPPVLEEMQPDIDTTVAGLARKFCDQSCMALQYDELVAEGGYKLAKIITRGELERQPTRVHFFKYFKTAVNNHFRSLVQRHRFTHKRTGAVPPPKHRLGEVLSEAETEVELRQHKQVELSLNDPEQNVQVAASADLPAAERELIADYLTLLTPVEQVVFNELIKPCARTRFLADIDAYIGKEIGSAHVVNVKQEHHAHGIGLSLGLFREAVLSVRTKISEYEAMTTQTMTTDLRRKAVIQQLSEIFSVHVPPNEPEILIRRLFTMAARDQYDKVTPQTEELLREVGAKPPRVYGDKLACYGVMFQRNDPRCLKCGLRVACATEAANYGLHKIAISRKLLGAKNTRIPVIMPELATVDTADDHHPVDPTTSTEMEVVAHLNNHFSQTQRKSETYYVHDSDKDRRLLFCLEATNPLRLRFCDPSPALKTLLTGHRKSWCAPTGISSDQLISLIDRHASETLENKKP